MMGSHSKDKKKNIPRSINEMSKEVLQETLKKKKECNKKALETVEQLCETNVEEEWFLANLQFINQTHFDDVIVERAITKLCGYPLCTGKIEKVLTQQYHISVKHNKVFDITERKNFCSSSCYKQAMFVKKQLFTSPLWFRDQEVIPKYTVLKLTTSNKEEEITPPDEKSSVNQPNENKSLEKISDLNKSIDDIQEKCLNIKITESNVTNSTNSEIEKKKEENVSLAERQKKEAVLKENISFSNQDTKPITSDKINRVEKSSTKAKIKTEPVNQVLKVEKAIFEWFSLDTLFYLLEAEKIKELYSDKAEELKQALSSRLKFANYGEKVEKIIQFFELFDSDSHSGSKVNLKPLPDYSVLKEEGKNLEIKVRAFYQGQLEVKKPEQEEIKKDEPAPNNDEIVYLPLVDAHAQLALRRKIVLDKLNRIIPDLIMVFSNEYPLQMGEFRNLVSTFSLAAHNITFKPNEWYLVGLILIKLLSLKDKHLETVLKLESSQSQLGIILASFELDKHYLENFVQRITDSKNIMEKLNECNK